MCCACRPCIHCRYFMCCVVVSHSRSSFAHTTRKSILKTCCNNNYLLDLLTYLTQICSVLLDLISQPIGMWLRFFLCFCVFLLIIIAFYVLIVSCLLACQFKYENFYSHFVYCTRPQPQVNR